MKSEDESTEVDFNAVLREEVLQYATKGIRECAAKRTENVNKDKLVLTMKQKHKNLRIVFDIDSMVKIVLYGGSTTLYKEVKWTATRMRLTLR